MKNSLSIIQQDINHLTENQKRIFLEKEQQKKIKELKEHCKKVIINKLIQLLERNNYDFYQVLNNKYIIIGHLIDEISNETIKKEIQKGTTRDETIKTGENFKTIITYEKRFNFNDEFISEILTNIFNSELSKIEKEQNKKEKYHKEHLREKLKVEITNIIENEKDNGITHQQLINIIGNTSVKEEIINDITQDEKEKAILKTIYTATINEIKKEYKYTIEHEKELQRFKNAQLKHIKIPVSHKILVFSKILKSIFK